MGKTHCKPKNYLVYFIKLYQYCLSPLLGNRCRFYPTCSDYAIEAIHEYGMIRGLYFSIKRLSCCHPWHSGGFDPIPKRDITC